MGEMPEDEAAGMVANVEAGGETPAPVVEPEATAPEAGDAAPAAPEAPTELAEDANEEQVAAHFRERIGKPFEEKHAEQYIRLSKRNRESKANDARVAELEAQIAAAPDGGKAVLKVLCETWERTSPGFLAKLEELGPKEFVKYMTDDNYGKPEAREGLDMDDPRDRRLAELEDWKTQSEEKQRKEAEEVAQDAYVADHKERTVKAVGALKPANDAERVLLESLVDAFAVQEVSPDTNLDKLNYAAYAARAQKLLTESRSQAAEDKQPDSLPRAVPANETDPASTDYGDESIDDKELAEMEKNALGK